MTEQPTTKVLWSEILEAETQNWDWDQVIKQHAGKPSIERSYALRRYFGLWDDADPVANAILDLVEAQNELAQAISAEQYADIDGAPEIGSALGKRAAAAKELMAAINEHEIFAELERRGLIVDSGSKQYSERTDRFETVWTITDLASKWLRPAKRTSK
jgi:hypothetical protein